jgi:DNA topoisomerase-1
MGDLYQALSAADEAGLLHVSDARPGIRRIRRGKGFSYLDPQGATIGVAERERIAAIAIPPAWTDVWICPRPDGHILATGRDAKGRKQYRYHPRWREVRDGDKYDRLGRFGRSLPGIRARLEEDLARRGLVEEKVLATVVSLLDESLIRIGNDEYAEQNESYGLTTIEGDHVSVSGASVHFEFRAKSGVEQSVDVSDKRLAKIVRQCQELPGEDLFAFTDDSGRVVDVTSTHVNDYLRSVTGDTFTAKDFRTWGGTVVAAEALAGLGPAATAREQEANVVAAIDTAAAALGNTRAVARSCYVHPGVTDAYREGSLAEAWRSARSRPRFRRPEAAVLTIVENSDRALPADGACDLAGA